MSALWMLQVHVLEDTTKQNYVLEITLRTIHANNCKRLYKQQHVSPLLVIPIEMKQHRSDNGDKCILYTSCYNVLSSFISKYFNKLHRLFRNCEQIFLNSDLKAHTSLTEYDHSVIFCKAFFLFLSKSPRRILKILLCIFLHPLISPREDVLSVLLLVFFAFAHGVVTSVCRERSSMAAGLQVVEQLVSCWELVVTSNTAEVYFLLGADMEICKSLEDDSF